MIFSTYDVTSGINAHFYKDSNRLPLYFNPFFTRVGVGVPVTPSQADLSSPAVSVSPARADFTLGNRKKSAGVKSGE